MKIRKLETEEKQNTKKLYEEVFSEDSKSFVDYYYEEKLKDKSDLCSRRGRRNTGHAASESI